MAIVTHNQIDKLIAQEKAINEKIRALQAKKRLITQERKRLQRLMARAEGRLKKVFKKQGKDILPTSFRRELEHEIDQRDFLGQIILERFAREREHVPGGERWTRLAPSTVKQRIAQGYGGKHPILLRTGQLREGAVKAVQGTYKYGKPVDFLKYIDKIGVDYAIYHQVGTSRMPDRPFFSNPTEKELAPLHKYIRARIRERISGMRTRARGA